MSKPDMDTIIKSPEAKMFLRMVTKDFYNNSYLGLWMYEVIGREWDEMREWAEELKAEIYPQTCTWSIDIWEWIYGIESNESLPLEYRRQKVLTKITGARPVNPETIRRGVAALAGMGIKVEVNGFAGPYQFDVVIHPEDTPLPYQQILRYINDVKPAHVRAICRAIIDSLGIEVWIRNTVTVERIRNRANFFLYSKKVLHYLNGLHYLDGSILLNEEVNNINTVCDKQRLSVAHKETIDATEITVKHNLYYLNGEIRLDGNTLLDAQEWKEKL